MQSHNSTRPIEAQYWGYLIMMQYNYGTGKWTTTEGDRNECMRWKAEKGNDQIPWWSMSVSSCINGKSVEIVIEKY